MQVDRLYLSVTLGCPLAAAGKVETNVGRDLRDRKRMAAFTAHSNTCETLISAGLSRFCTSFKISLFEKEYPGGGGGGGRFYVGYRGHG